MLEKSSLTYTRLFCEENIWKLIESFESENELQAIDVLFLINDSNTVAVFDQLAAQPDAPVIWDYHVILCALVDRQPVIYDFDSRCPFPCELEHYFDRTFCYWHEMDVRFRPWIRRIDAASYYRHFASDRSHMRGQIDEKDFPTYPVLQPLDHAEAITLQQYRDIHSHIKDSVIVSPADYLHSIKQKIGLLQSVRQSL